MQLIAKINGAALSSNHRIDYLRLDDGQLHLLVQGHLFGQLSAALLMPEHLRQYLEFAGDDRWPTVP